MDMGWLKDRQTPRPVIMPGLADRWIFAIPNFSKGFKYLFGPGNSD
jgi:hypothetical protein